jgi:hypothetical protein
MTFVRNQARIIACDLEVPLNQLCIYENNLVARPSTCAEGRFFIFRSIHKPLYLCFAGLPDIDVLRQFPIP